MAHLLLLSAWIVLNLIVALAAYIHNEWGTKQYSNHCLLQKSSIEVRPFFKNESLICWKTCWRRHPERQLLLPKVVPKLSRRRSDRARVATLSTSGGSAACHVGFPWSTAISSDQSTGRISRRFGCIKHDVPWCTQPKLMACWIKNRFVLQLLAGATIDSYVPYYCC